MDYTIKDFESRAQNGSMVVMAIGQPALEDQRAGFDLAMTKPELETYARDMIGTKVYDTHNVEGDYGSVIAAFVSKDKGDLVVAVELHGQSEESKDMIGKIRSGEYTGCSLGCEYTYKKVSGVEVKDRVYPSEFSFTAKDNQYFEGARIVSATAASKAKKSREVGGPTMVVKDMNMNVETGSEDGKTESGKFVGPWYLVEYFEKEKIRKQRDKVMSTENEELKKQIDAMRAERDAALKAKTEQEEIAKKASEDREAAVQAKAEMVKATKIEELKKTVMPIVSNAKKWLENEDNKEVTGRDFLLDEYAGMEDVEKVYEMMTGDEGKFNMTMAYASQFAASQQKLEAAASAMEVESAAGGVEGADSGMNAMPNMSEASNSDGVAPMGVARGSYDQNVKVDIEAEVQRRLKEEREAQKPVFNWQEEQARMQQRAAQQPMKSSASKGQANPTKSAASRKQKATMYSDNILRLSHAVDVAQKNGGRLSNKPGMPTASTAARGDSTKGFELSDLMIGTPDREKKFNEAVNRQVEDILKRHPDAHKMSLQIPQYEIEAAQPVDRYQNFTSYGSQPKLVRSLE